jgi:hypothetical protein
VNTAALHAFGCAASGPAMSHCPDFVPTHPNLPDNGASPTAFINDYVYERQAFHGRLAHWRHNCLLESCANFEAVSQRDITMKVLVACCVCLSIIAPLFNAAGADESRLATPGHEADETLPKVGEVLLISFPNISGDDLLSMEFVVTREMLDTAWSLNDVFVAAKLEARAGHLPVENWNKTLETPEGVYEQDESADDESGCD